MHKHCKGGRSDFAVFLYRFLSYKCEQKEYSQVLHSDTLESMDIWIDLSGITFSKVGMIFKSNKIFSFEKKYEQISWKKNPTSFAIDFVNFTLKVTGLQIEKLYSNYAIPRQNILLKWKETVIKRTANKFFKADTFTSHRNNMEVWLTNLYCHIMFQRKLMYFCICIITWIFHL